MAKPGRKPAGPKNKWQLAEHYESEMARIDRAEAAAVAKFKAEREELKAKTPAAVLAAIRAMSKAGIDEPETVRQSEPPAAEPDMSLADLEAATAPEPARKPNGKSNGHMNGQHRAQA